MIKNKEDFKFYIKEDKKRNIGEVSYVKYIACMLYRTDGYMVYKYLKALREYEYAINVLPKNIIGRIVTQYKRVCWRRLGIKYGLMLPPNVIGYGFKISHIVGGGVIINCKSIGNYCSANAGVVVGNNGGQDKIATIGDNVTLTVGSKVIGNVTIGNNVIVAPNSVVVKDVPSNSVVSGIPAKIIKKLEQYEK